MPKRQYSPSCERNRDPILSVLRDVLPAAGLVVEVGCGTGQHGVYFAESLPTLEWQPADRAGTLESVNAHRDAAGLDNLRAPLEFDLFDAEPPVKRADAVVCINVVHIAPWAAVERLFIHAASMLEPRGVLYVYGPYRYRDKPLERSNESFDLSLKARNPESGVRDFEAVDAFASDQGFKLGGDVSMPANNRSIWWTFRP